MISLKYIYYIDPIDYWDGWRKIDDLPDIGPADFTVLTKKEFRGFLAPALEIAKKFLFFEGDFVVEPRWAPLPCWEPGMWAFVAAWKQHNNGSSYVASPFSLPWLEGPYARYWRNGVLVAGDTIVTRPDRWYVDDDIGRLMRERGIDFIEAVNILAAERGLTPG